MHISALDTLLAGKVVNVIPGLRPSDRRVAVTLIEHFNRRTGRCDPSLERIARLLGVCTRTVIRSTQRLEAAGLFRKVRHGGYSNRNSYVPNWSRLAELGQAWNEKLREQSVSRQTKMSPGVGQACHVRSDNAVTQTCMTNLKTQTFLGSPKDENMPSNLRLSEPQPRSCRMKHRDAARAAAERRWADQLLQRFRSTPITYAEVIEAITPAMQEGATDAEVRQSGDGLRYILARLDIPDHPGVSAGESSPAEPVAKLD
jgi:hypothetical protein